MLKIYNIQEKIQKKELEPPRENDIENYPRQFDLIIIQIIKLIIVPIRRVNERLCLIKKVK